MKILVPSMLAVSSLALHGCGSRPSPAPPRDETPVEIAERASSIVIPVTAPLSALQDRLNTDVPSRLVTIDETRDGCVPARWARVCIGLELGGSCRGQEVRTKITPEIDCTLDGYVDRGGFAVSGSGQTLSLSVPVNASVTARGRGEIGRHIRTTANGSVNVRANAAFDISEDWVPKATVATDYSWNDKLGIDILGFRVTFSGQADPQIRDILRKFEQDVPGYVGQLELKQRMDEIWRKAFEPVRLAENPESWLRFTPQAVGFSGFTLDNGQIATTLMLEGKTETFLGAKPKSSPVTPLPRLAREIKTTGFHFFLPVTADYTLMTTQAERALSVGKPQHFDIQGLGKVEATFKKVEIYQTRDRSLAIGITLDADPERDWFDTRGTVWFIAKPQFDDRTKRVWIDKMAVFGDTNNETVDLLLKIINFKPANDRLRKSLVYDFSKEWDDALAKAGQAMTVQTPSGLNLFGTITNANLVGSSTTPRGFYLGLETHGTMQAVFDQPAATAQ